MKHFYVVRHGLTDAALVDTSHKNVTLNTIGRQQIQHLISLLPIYQVDCIYTSPTLRTIETAEILRSSPDIPLHTDHRLLNKVSTEYPDYQDNLKSLLHDLQSCPYSTILLITHGRIIKFLFALLSPQPINTDTLSLEYGDAFYFFLDETFHFPKWSPLGY